MLNFKNGDQVRLKRPYRSLEGQITGTTYTHPMLYQIDVEDGTRLPYVESEKLELLCPKS
jgi:hypothetical protein